MRILIVADDRPAAERLERLLADTLGTDAAVTVHMAARPAAARAAIRDAAIDLLFLDLDLRKDDPLSLLEEAPDASFQTIVLAAGADQAPRAVELGIAGYLLKPVERASLERALLRLRAAPTRSPRTARYLGVRRRGGLRLIPIEAVVYARAAGAYSEVILRSGDSQLLPSSLGTLQRRLPDGFERIHRSYLVNMASVISFLTHEGSRYEVVLEGGRRLPVGRTRFREIRERAI